MATRNLKIMQWNACGITNHVSIKLLENFITLHKIDIVLLNETFLKNHHKFYLNGYKIYRNDRQNRHGGGVAIAVKFGILHRLVNPYQTVHLENISVIVKINNREIVITSAYSPKYCDSFESDVKKITPLNREFFVFGDLNAKNGQWNCNVNNRAGIKLEHISMNSNFFIYYPDSPTFHPRSGANSSTLDILLSNSSLYISDLVVYDDDMFSDHLPVIFHIDGDTSLQSKGQIFNFKRANWRKFNKYIDEHIMDIQFDPGNISKNSIDTAINKVSDIIINAQSAAIPLKQISTSSNQLPDSILALISYKNNINRKLHRSTDEDLNILLRSLRNQCNTLIKTNINNHRNNKFNSLLANFDTGCKKFWNITKHLRGKYSRKINNLISNNGEIFTSEDKVNELADIFAKNSELTSNYCHSNDVKVNRLNRRLDRDNFRNDDSSTCTSADEISSIINSLKPSKAPGIDKIQNRIIKKLPFNLISIIAVIFNGCLQMCYFPNKFKIAKVIAIPKPGKDNRYPINYRPISLLSCFGKLFERVIHNRISDFCSSNQVILPEQFGFKRNHSTIHQICRLNKIIKRNKFQRRSTGVVLLDFEKAYDTVWHNGLIFKLNQFNFPIYLCKLIKSFVTNRKFMVNYDGHDSDLMNVSAGLPQGSVLSPTLYSIFISDFVKPKSVDIALYADDTCLISSAKSSNVITRRLNKSFIQISKYFYKWKIKINEGKTQAIIFPFNNSAKRIPSERLQFNNTTINYSNQVKYLGVIMDQKLIYQHHINSICIKVNNCFKALYSCLARKSFLSTKNKMIIFKTILRPIMQYGCEIWCTAAKCHLKKLQTIQNKFLKIIFNLNRRFSTIDLHDLAKVELFENLIFSRRDRLIEKCIESDHDIIRQLVDL